MMSLIKTISRAFPNVRSRLAGEVKQGLYIVSIAADLDAWLNIKIRYLVWF